EALHRFQVGVPQRARFRHQVRVGLESLEERIALEGEGELGLVEDMEDDVLLLLNELKRGGYLPVHTRVDRPDVLSKLITQEEWDIIFCDYSMPKMNGVQALNIVRQFNQEVPFIFVSGTIGEDTAVETMRAGAQDYIIKGNLKRLEPAVRRELEEARNRKERRAAEKRLHFLVNYDSLTRLPNRLQFLNRLEQYILKARQLGQAIAVAHLDLDHFKKVNDSLGYEAGNLLLVDVAGRLGRCVGDSGIVARLAADEFAILIREPGDSNVTSARMQNLLTTLEEPFDIHGCTLHIQASLGVSLFPQDAEQAEHLLRNADIATYRAKDAGGKCYLFYNQEMAVQLEERLALEQDIRQALEKQEFTLHYQPQVSLSSGKITGVEALVRWNRPQGMVSPDCFIPLAEETGLIVPLGEWVLKTACAQARQWREVGLPELCMAVNVSAHQFHQVNLLELVMHTLEEYGLPPSLLELEITESSIMQDPEQALETLKKLQEHGVKVSLDDFGTGYSSLSYLKYFKVDTLKIDRAFIKDIPQDHNDVAITAAVIAMANKLNMRVVAEGIETPEQYQFLQREGCDCVQGYFLCRPMSADQLEPILQLGCLQDPGQS
ncbi:putative bifunctional diguanylate cyclase/phosphodiesterase, partial [Porticoccus sp.]